MVEDDGAPHTIRYNLRQGERKEPAIHNRQWKILVAGKKSRGTVSAGVCTRGVENQIWECYATRKMFARSSEDAATALKLGKRWTRGVARQELALLRESKSVHLPRHVAVELIPVSVYSTLPMHVASWCGQCSSTKLYWFLMLLVYTILPENIPYGKYSLCHELRNIVTETETETESSVVKSTNSNIVSDKPLAPLHATMLSSQSRQRPAGRKTHSSAHRGRQCLLVNYVHFFRIQTSALNSPINGIQCAKMWRCQRNDHILLHVRANGDRTVSRRRHMRWLRGQSGHESTDCTLSWWSIVSVNRTPCHIACTDADTLSPQHMALIRYTLTRGSSCAFHKKSHSISSFAPCLTTCTVHPAFCPLFHCPLLLLRSPAQV